MKNLLTRRTNGPQMKPATRVPARARKPSPVVIQQARLDQFTRWTADLVKRALDAHEQGDFSQSAMLIDSMGRDDRIAAVIGTRVNAIVGANGPDFSIEPPDGQSDELAQRVSTWWFETVPDDVMRAIAMDMLMAGLHVSRVHWALTENEWRPVRLERWHLGNLYWDDQIERFIARTDGGEETVEPGDPNWLVIAPGGARTWMSGGVRAMGLAYLMRQFNFRDWTRFNERHGLPIITVEEPAGGDERKKNAFYQSIQRMGSGGIIRLPQNQAGVGYKLAIVEAKDAAHQTFTAFRQDLDTCIAVFWLGQNLSTEVKGGSFAAATAHDRIRADYLEADTECLSTQLRAQLLLWYCRFNVASFSDEDAPWPTWQTAVAVDKKVEAETAKASAEAIALLRKTKMPIDFKVLLEKLGLSILEGSDPNNAEAMDPEPQPGTVSAPPGGQKVAVPVPKPAPKKAQVRLASGASLKGNTGFVDGQVYVDDLVDNGRTRGADDQGGFLDDLLAIIQNGSDYQTIRDLVLRHYQDAQSPVELRETLQKVLVLAQLAGRVAVEEDA